MILLFLKYSLFNILKISLENLDKLMKFNYVKLKYKANIKYIVLIKLYFFKALQNNKFIKTFI